MSGAKKKVILALPVIGQPRYAKRIAMLREAGFAVEAFAFERAYHRGRLPDCPTRVLGRLEHGRYLKRAGKLLAAVPSIRRAIGENDVVYAFGPDMALICRLSGLGLGRPLVLEIGDIRATQTAAGPKGKLVRWLDRVVADRCHLLVATAEGFIDDYYRKWIGTETPALILENKQEPPSDLSGAAPPPEKQDGVPLADRPLRIGYFGLLRSDRSWEVLERLAASRPQEIEIVAAGVPMAPEDIPARAARHANIVFKGQYRSPDDLPSLYASVDIAWACYPFPEKGGDRNWRWARTNRFYECCFYGTPMIALADSGDAPAVEEHGIGILVPDAEADEIVKVLAAIDAEGLAAWRANIAKLPREVYMLTNETAALKEALTAITASSRP